jgi:hypothetical protein
LKGLLIGGALPDQIVLLFSQQRVVLEKAAQHRGKPLKVYQEGIVTLDGRHCHELDVSAQFAQQIRQCALLV